MLGYRVSIRFSNQDSSSFLPNHWTHTHTQMYLTEERSSMPSGRSSVRCSPTVRILTSSIQVYNWIIRRVCLSVAMKRMKNVNERFSPFLSLPFVERTTRWRSQVFRIWRFDDLFYLICIDTRKEKQERITTFVFIRSIRSNNIELERVSYSLVTYLFYLDRWLPVELLQPLPLPF